MSLRASRIAPFRSEQVLGLVVVSLGVFVLSGWLLRQATWVRLFPDSPSMVVNAAVMFVLCGAALMLPPLGEARGDRWRRWLPILIIVLAAMHLPETLFDVDLGLDRADWHAWLDDGNPRPGRMTALTSSLFLLVGVVLLLAQSDPTPAIRSAMAGLTWFILLAASGALVGTALDAANVYPAYLQGSFALHTAVGFVLLALGLRRGWNGTAPEEVPPTHEQRIVAVGTWALVIVASLAALPGYLILQQQTARTLGNGLASALRGRIDLITNTIDLRSTGAALFARDPILAPAIAAVLDTRDAANLARLLAEVERLVPFGFHSVRVLAGSGSELLAAGMPVSQNNYLLPLGVAGPGTAELLWDGGLVLRNRLPIGRDGDPVATLETYQALTRTTKAFLDLQELGESAELLLCRVDARFASCFPTRHSAAPLTIPLVEGGRELLLKVTASGGTGFQDGRDYRSRRVIGAYAPLPGLGLVAVLKVDTAELYGPIVARFQMAVLLLVGMVTLGSWVLRTPVRPLTLQLRNAEMEARRAGTALAESTALQVSVLEEAPNAILVVARDGRIVMVNARAESIFGYPRERLEGLPVEALIPADTRAAHAGLRAGFDETRSLRTMGEGRSLRALHADGHEIPVEVLLSPIHGSAEGLVVATVQELSGRVAADAALRASEARFRSTLENAPIGMALVSREGRFLDVNAALCAILGRDRTALLACDFQSLTHPDDLDADLADVARLLADEIPDYRIEKRYLHSDGREVWVALSVCLIRDEAGLPLHFIKQIQDISAERRMREALNAVVSFQSALLKVSRIVIIAGGTDGLIRLFSRGAEEMLGYAEAEVVGAVTPLHFLDPDELRQFATRRGVDLGDIDTASPATYREALRIWPQEPREWTYVRKDGRRIPVWLVTAPIHSEGGEALGYLGIATDVSERRERELQLAAALRDKEVLLKEVYHRVKNNLQVVSSLLRLQARELREGLARDALSESVGRVRAMALVHEKLYQSGGLETVALDGYIGQLCRHIADSGGLQRRRITLETNVDPTAHVGLDTAVPLGLLLNELVLNCLKHAWPEGEGGTISVSLEREPGGGMELTVADDGGGLSGEFDPVGATGLGYKLVHALAGQLRGEVRIDGDGGARIRVRFPQQGGSAIDA